MQPQTRSENHKDDQVKPLKMKHVQEAPRRAPACKGADGGGEAVERAIPVADADDASGDRTSRLHGNRFRSVGGVGIGIDLPTPRADSEEPAAQKLAAMLKHLH